MIQRWTDARIQSNEILGCSASSALVKRTLQCRSMLSSTRRATVYLTMNATKDELKAAPGLRYERSTTTWVLDTGSSDRPPANNGISLDWAASVVQFSVR